MINEDDIVKSKLTNYQANFQKSDWEDMEKMLDAKADKKPIALWWRYGMVVALSLLFIGGASIGYFSRNIHSSHHIASVKDGALKANGNTNSHAITKSTVVSSTSTSATTLVGTPVNSANNYSAANTNSLALKKQLSNRTKASNGKHAVEQLMMAANTNNKLPSQQNFSSEYSGADFANSLGQNNQLSKKQGDFIAYAKQQITSISNELGEQQIKSLAENFATTSKKNTAKKIPLSYSIAFQMTGLIDLGLYKNKVSLYLDQFSDATVIGRIMIGTHLGLYVGVGYADRKSINHIPSATLFKNEPFSTYQIVKDKSQGVSIPIGVVANLYKHAYVDVYAKTGINNIFFVNQLTTVKYSNTPINSSSAPDKLVGNTLFTGSSDLSFSNSYKSSNNILSDNSSKQVTYRRASPEKYLAELNFALGVNAKMTKNLSVLIEPAYRMGLKNKYRSDIAHNFSLSGALMIRF